VIDARNGRDGSLHAGVPERVTIPARSACDLRIRHGNAANEQCEGRAAARPASVPTGGEGRTTSVPLPESVAAGCEAAGPKLFTDKPVTDQSCCGSNAAIGAVQAKPAAAPPALKPSPPQRSRQSPPRRRSADPGDAAGRKGGVGYTLLVPAFFLSSPQGPCSGG